MCWDIISNSNDNAIIASVTEGDRARMSGAPILQKQIEEHQQRNYHRGAGQSVPHLLFCQMSSLHQTKLTRIFQTYFRLQFTLRLCTQAGNHKRLSLVTVSMETRVIASATMTTVITIQLQRNYKDSFFDLRIRR
jgi:hypothetical protein